MSRAIPRKFAAIWAALGALFIGALFLPDGPSWWLSAFTLAWFAFWEARGIANKRPSDTLSESIWAILDVENHQPTNRALFPLVMGVFAAAAVLFVGLVEGAGERSMSVWPRSIGACFVAAGTLAFLVRHFRRGDSR